MLFFALMGGKNKPWTGCHACGAWLYNWRLERQRGFCGCGQRLEQYTKASPAKHANNTNKQISSKDKPLSDLLALLPSVDLDPKIKDEIGKLVANTGSTTDPKASDPYKIFQQARATEVQKRQQVEKAARLHAEAVQSVTERQQALEAAITECIVAEQAAATALADYNSSMGLEVGRAADASSATSNNYLGFDRKMFDEADEYPEEVANELRKTRADVESMVGIIENKKKELEAIVAGGKRTLEQATKKRKAGDGTAQAASAPAESSFSSNDKETKANEKDKEKEVHEKAEFEKAFQARMEKEKQAAAEILAAKNKSKQLADPTPAEAAKLVGASRARPPSAAGGARV